MRTANNDNKTASAVLPRPPKDHPLRVHQGSGQYYKTIKGRAYYFGKIGIPNGLQLALAKYTHDLPYIARGEPIPSPNGATVATIGQCVNAFLKAKQDKRNARRIGASRLQDIRKTMQALLDQFGEAGNPLNITPEMWAEFRAALDKKYGASRLAQFIGTIREMSSWASHEDRLLIQRGFRFGEEFTAPSKREIRHAKILNRIDAPAGFEPAEIRKIIKAIQDRTDDPTWGSFWIATLSQVLLALNGAYTQKELSTLTLDDVTRADRTIEHLRDKSGELRVVPLWNRTVDAVEAAIKVRPKPSSDDYSALLFLTRQGLPIVREDDTDGKLKKSDAIATKFNKLLRSLGLKRSKIGFGKIRHTAYSLMGADQDARALIAGHANESPMASSYLQAGLSAVHARLVATAGLVEREIFGAEGPKVTGRKRAKPGA